MSKQYSDARGTTTAVLAASAKTGGHIAQFVAYAKVGALATLVHYSLLVVLVQSLGINPLLSSTAGFAAGGLTAYLLNYRYTFASDQCHLQAAGRFVVVALLGMLLNAATMSIGVYLLALHYLLSQAVATGFVLVWTYGANRYWTFR